MPAFSGLKFSFYAVFVASLLSGASGLAEERSGALSASEGVAAGRELPLKSQTEPTKQPEDDALPSFTEELSLRDAIDRTLTFSPAVKAALIEVDARRGEELQAAVRPNPELMLEVENFARNRQDDNTTESTLSFAQTLELGDKRIKRLEAAHLDTSLSGWDYETARVNAATLAAQAFVEVLIAQDRIKVLHEFVTIADKTRAGTDARVKGGNGVPVYLKDVAVVGIGKELRTGSASEDGVEVVVGTAMMLKGGNSRIVSGLVDEKMQTIGKSLPPDIAIKTVLNRTQLVDATVKTVAKNLAEGALLVVVVLFLMLGNLRAALITAIVIPVTMLMTTIGMLETGISANLMSLGAVDFGLIVDGAVIITENALRRLAERQHHEGRLLTLNERLHEVMIASKEMIQPSVFGQMIIITVYFPLLTFTGVEGKMFEPMGLTVIIALACAFVLSLTFVPAMIAIFVSGKVDEKENWIVRNSKETYEPVLRKALKKPGVVIWTALGIFVFSIFLFTRLGQEFIPQLDEKNLAMHAMRIPSTSLTQSQEMQSKVEATIRKFPEVAFVFSKTGTAEMAADPMPPHVSDTFIILKPQSEWRDPDMTKTELVDEINDAVGQLPGNNYEYTQPIQMRFNELIAGVRSDVAVKVFGDDFDQLGETAKKVASVLRTVQGSADVKVEQTTGLPMLNIKLDKMAVARYGLNIGEVLDIVSIAVGGRETGLVFQGDRRFDIVVRLPDSLRDNMEELENLPVAIPDTDGETGNKPNFIPLKTLATFSVEEGPNQISREDGKRRVVVQANVRGRDIGSFVAEAQEMIDAQVKVPAGEWLTWGGQFENLQTAQARLLIVVPACFFIIFLMLFTAVGNVRETLLVFSGVPLAISGGIITLFLRDMPFSISAAVGFIALSGIAVLNGLVMVTYIKQLREDGMSGEEAIFAGAMTRLRPVLMTALVASLGFVPMAIATGTGAEVQKPLATVVIGGLISATILTLVVLPALYKRFCLVEIDEEDLLTTTNTTKEHSA